MKAELKITPAQEPQWDKVAQAMRQDDSERRQTIEQMRANQRPAAERAAGGSRREARFGATRGAADRPLPRGVPPAL